MFFLQLNVLDVSFGHARMRKPSSRASMWRDGFPTEKDYNDNEGFCGGFAVRPLQFYLRFDY
jgi:hypothetical protein